MRWSPRETLELNEILVYFREYVNFLLAIILENIGFLFQAIILMNQLRFQEMIKLIHFVFRFREIR